MSACRRSSSQDYVFADLMACVSKIPMKDCSKGGRDDKVRQDFTRARYSTC